MRHQRFVGGFKMAERKKIVITKDDPVPEKEEKRDTPKDSYNDQKVATGVTKLVGLGIYIWIVLVLILLGDWILVPVIKDAITENVGQGEPLIPEWARVSLLILWATLPVLGWIVVSFMNIINPDEVALIQF